MSGCKCREPLSIIQLYFRLLAEFTLARDLITPHVVGARLKNPVISCKLQIVHTSLLFPGPVQEQVRCKCVNGYALHALQM